MTISRRVARPLLSSIFLMGGWDAFRNPEGKVKRADPVAQAIATKVPALPQDTEALVRLNGAVMIGAGALLAVGKYPRLASLALIGTILPTTYAGHRFWEETDEVTRAQQRVQFVKNLGLLGGLILAVVDTEGAPSLGWRARRRAERASRILHAQQNRAARSRRLARESARRQIKAQKAALVGAQQAAARTAVRGRAVAQPVLSTGVHRAGELLENVAGHVQDLVPVGS